VEIAKLDADFCSAEGKQVLRNAIYESVDTVSSLRSMVTTMISLKHNITCCKNFYELLVFLLTLPVTPASCKRAHSKIDLVKSAVRASMISERLQDLVWISAEKICWIQFSCRLLSIGLLLGIEVFLCEID
jgi:hypothetical protein